MSLLDTIKGAREEATEVVAQRTSAKKDADASDKKAASEGEPSSSSAGFSKRSTARAKPRREAAGSVQTSSTGSAKGKELSKEEKKAARDRRRTEEGIDFDASQILLKEQPGYKKSQRLWWILMGVGVACTLASWGIMHYMQSAGLESQTLMTLCVALMVIAYVLIIGAFIFDLVKVRPMRRKAQELSAGMTLRRKKKLIAENEAKGK